MSWKRTDSGRKRALGIASIWAGIGLFDALQTVFTMRSQGMHHAWTALFITRLLAWLPWALATPLVMRIVRQFPRSRIGNPSTWLTHMGALLGINLVQAAWMAGLQLTLNPWAQSGPPPWFGQLVLSGFSYELLPAVILYASVATIVLMLDAREGLAREQTHTARLNEQLSRAQLHSLQRQIEPHFMFNTLNAISGLVREQRNDEAVNMVASLSDFLRRTIEGAENAQVTLSSELEYLQHYLAIQKMRFSDRLQVSVDVRGDLLAALVPSLVLQPLVENAIKHGITRRVQGGSIRIAASQANGRLSLSVYNDGPRLLEAWETRCRGIGLTNLRTRMQLLYGSSFELSLQDAEQGGVRALVTIPFKSAPAAKVA
jgi:two-component system LytT family sensor kinase